MASDKPQPSPQMAMAARVLGEAIHMVPGHRGLIDIRPVPDGSFVAQVRIKNAAGREGRPGYYTVKVGARKRFIVQLLGSDGQATFDAVAYGSGWHYKIEWG